MADLLSSLNGGDLRSPGRSDEIVQEVNTQQRFDDLFKFLLGDDRLVVMRAGDAVEKISRREPGFLQKHKPALMRLSIQAKNIELKWHLALILSRLLLTKMEVRKAWSLLTGWATNKKESRIVRVNSIQALYELAQKNPELSHDYKLTVSEIGREGIPSINARIRKLQKVGAWVAVPNK